MAQSKLDFGENEEELLSPPLPLPPPPAPLSVSDASSPLSSPLPPSHPGGDEEDHHRHSDEDMTRSPDDHQPPTSEYDDEEEEEPPSPLPPPPLPTRSTSSSSFSRQQKKKKQKIQVMYQCRICKKLSQSRSTCSKHCLFKHGISKKAVDYYIGIKQVKVDEYRTVPNLCPRASLKLKCDDDSLHLTIILKSVITKCSSISKRTLEAVAGRHDAVLNFPRCIGAVGTRIFFFCHEE